MALSVVQLHVFALASRLGLFRTSWGEQLIQRMAGPEISPAGLEYAHRTWNDPRGLSQTATTVARLASYARETASALRTGPLPGIPVEVVVPQRRSGYPPVRAERLHAAHSALARRFPRGELGTAAHASHAIPLDRSDVITDNVLDLLRTTGDQ